MAVSRLLPSALLLAGALVASACGSEPLSVSVESPSGTWVVDELIDDGDLVPITEAIALTIEGETASNGQPSGGELSGGQGCTAVSASIEWDDQGAVDIFEMYVVTFRPGCSANDPLRRALFESTTWDVDGGDALLLAGPSTLLTLTRVAG